MSLQKQKSVVKTPKISTLFLKNAKWPEVKNFAPKTLLSLAVEFVVHKNISTAYRNY